MPLNILERELKKKKKNPVSLKSWNWLSDGAFFLGFLGGKGKDMDLSCC